MQTEIGTKYWWLNDESLAVLNRGYLLHGETVEQAIDRICDAASKRLYKPELKEVFIEIISKGWLSLSSPIWANMGTQRGLPISCFNVHIPDNIEGIATKYGEIIMQTKIGGGTSSYFGELRGRGAAITDNGKSSGAISFMEPIDTLMSVVSQGGVRRGKHACYLDIDHPDIEEFLRIKDVGNPIQDLFTGVCVPDYWLNEMIEGDEEKRELWAKILESRQTKGLPYLFFTDNVNRQKPQIYKKLQIPINSSNLCMEVMLPSNKDESFVCCLSSLNLALYDEWKDTDTIKYAIYFLDAVMSEFIEKTRGKFGLKSANKFAERHRALGLGVLGYHSYLQSKNIAFDDLLNVARIEKLFKSIQEKALEASKELAKIYGPAPIFEEVKDYEGIKYRNTTVMTIPPTTSSSSILGQVSPGIEPYSSNYYKAGLAKGNFIRKNKYLQKVLEELGKDDEETWRSIMINQGSVQHLDFLDEHTKDVFKTFKEINQQSIIDQAVARQKYIDQGQSLNINIPPEIPIKEVNRLILDGWKKGIKGFYYQRSQSVTKELLTNIVNCKSCEG